MSTTNPVWYCGSTKYAAVAAWAAGTAYAAAALVRQLATPTAGSERVFACVVAGTSGGSEPTWTTTQGGATADNTVTWREVTGKAGVNGDLTNTATWTAVKNSAVPAGTLIQRTGGGSLQLCTTAGTASNGAEPSFSNTAGTTTADGTVTWTSLGPPGNFGAWAAPWARLNLMLGTSATFALAGETCYVSNSHAETQSTGLSYQGAAVATAASPFTVLCVGDTAAPPTALATTGSVTTTGASNLNLSGYFYCYGLNFYCGTGSSAANITTAGILAVSGVPNYESCGFNLVTTAAGSTLGLFGNASGGQSGYGVMRTCTFTFGATGQKITSYGPGLIQGGSVAATGAVPTTAFAIGNAGGSFVIQDCDLSAVVGTLVGSSSVIPGDVYIENCKLGAGVTIQAAVSDSDGTRVHLANGDGTSTNYRYFFQTYFGSAVHETSVVRTGGASDGTQQLSWNATTNTHSKFINPFVTEDIAQWQDTTGSAKTATVELTTDATLNTNDCWLEIEYPGSSGTPVGSTVTTKMAWFGTPAA
jgi:hypothetical protein